MRSKFEEHIGNLFKKHRIKYKYEAEFIPYTVEAKYIPDFKIGDTFIEAKGWLRPSDRAKMLLVKQQHPDIDIRIWFQQDNWLTNKKLSRYSDWAYKHGFPFHIGKELPHDWFE